jgi:hypothetical protein
MPSCELIRFVYSPSEYVTAHFRSETVSSPGDPRSAFLQPRVKMSDGHLFLSARGGVDYARGLRAWHDEAHGSLLLLSARSWSLRQVSLDTTGDLPDALNADAGRKDGDDGSSRGDANEDARVDVLYQFDGAREVAGLPPVELARLSVDGEFVALQTSDIEVQVVRRATRETFWVLCKSKGGNRILPGGLLWSTHAPGASRSQDLFLVTKRGLEQYRVSSKRRDCRLHRAISAQIHAHWHAPAHDVLFVAAGARGTELVPYLLRGSSVEKLPRLVFSSPVRQQDLFLASMYGALYAVYSDMRTSKLLLYLVGRAKVTCVRSLHLMLPPGTALKFSVVDNLLVCHSLDFNVSLFFDVHCDGSVNDPFSAPLPVSLLPPECQNEMVTHEPLVITDSLNTDQDDECRGDLKASELRSDNDESDGGNENDDVNTFDRQVRTIRRAISVGDLDTLSTSDESGDMDIVPLAPVSNPTPLQQQTSRLLPRAMTVDESTMKRSKHHAQQHQLELSADQSSFSRWHFLSPNLVQRSALRKTDTDAKVTELMQVRTLQVNLREICRSAAHHREILPFLLRRGDDQLAKQLVLKLVRDHIVEQLPRLSAISTLLSYVQTLTSSDIDNATASRGQVGDASSDDEDEDTRTHSSAQSSSDSFDHNGASGNGTPREVLRGISSPSTVKSARADEPDSRARLLPVRNAQGFIHIFQSDFFRHVWYPLLQDSTVRNESCTLQCSLSMCVCVLMSGLQFAKSGKMSIYISEYVKNLRQNSIPVESIT